LGVSGLYANQIFGQPFHRDPLGVQLYSVRDAVSKNLEGALTQLAGLGFKNLEIYGYNGTFFGRTANEFKTILNNTGLSVISSHHTTGIAKPSKGTLTEGWPDTIADIKTIGGKYMICSYLFAEERTPKIYAELPELLDRSGIATRDAGIQFGYHNHDFEFEKYENTLVYDHIITKTNPELVVMEMDLYWISKAGYDPVAYFNKYPGRFPLWHVKDMFAGTKEITEVGNGTINFDRIFAARETAGLKYWFVEQDVSKGNIFESLKASQVYLSKKDF